MVKGSDIVRYQHLFNKVYNDALTELDNTNAWNALAGIGTEITSDGSEEDYRWLQENPEFELWVGDRNLADLKDYKYTIRNVDFQASVKIFKNELDDDKMNIILPRIRGMAGGEMRKWGKLIHDALVSGISALAFDGIAFFADASGDRLNDNLLAGTISAGTPTLAQAAADVITVRKAMLGFKNSRGEILGIVPDTYVVPPNLETVFLSLMGSVADPTGSNAASNNPYRTYIKKVIVDPGLTDANDFYALATNYSVGPLVRQKRQGVEFVLDDTFVNVNKTYFFGGDFRGAVGYGLPHLAAKVVSSVS